MINEERFREIAEVAMSYLHDEGMLSDFLNDRDIDLTEDEREYFIPEEENDL